MCFGSSLRGAALGAARSSFDMASHITVTLQLTPEAFTAETAYVYVVPLVSAVSV